MILKQFGPNDYAFVYRSFSSEFIVEGSDANECVAVLCFRYPDDRFVLSVDAKQITHFKNDEVIDVFKQVKP